MPKASALFDMLMYADDTTLYCNINTLINESIINDELDKIKMWLSANKLSLNIGKTKYMVYHSINKQIVYPNLKINNIEIERVQQFNFLGLLLDNHLHWKLHIDHISSKISKVTGIMYKLKLSYPKPILLTLYNTLIVPHFHYCLLTWGSLVKKNHKIHMLQKKAIRIISNAEFTAHTEPLCKSLRIVQVPDMFRIALWKFYYKLINHTLPTCFNYIIPHLPLICNYYTIRKPVFTLPKLNIELMRMSLKYQLLTLLNNEYGSILITAKVHTHSFLGFKLFLKNTIIDLYVDNCNVVNCYCRRQII